MFRIEISKKVFYNSLWIKIKYFESGEKVKLENDLGKDNIKKLVFKLAIPSMVAQFVSVLYSVVDRIYIGNISGIGEIALAGIGICAPILTLISAFATWIGIGGAPLMSIKLGEKDNEGAKKILANCFMMLLVISFIITILTLIFKEKLLFYFGASQRTYPYAEDYFTIYLLGTVFVLMTIGLNQFILCQGYAKVAMKSVILGAVVNIVLDPIFIFGFNLDVKGAAIATVISQICSCIYVLRFLLGKKVPIGISFKGYSKEIMLRVLKIGISPFLIIALDNLMIIAVNTVLQKYGGLERGDMLLACTAIIQSFMLIVTMPLGGITTGTQAILGYNYGARNSKRVLEAEKYICILSIIFVTIMFAIAYTMPRQFARIFTSNKDYIEMTARGIKIYTMGLLGMAIQYVVVDGFTGMGEVKLAMPLSMFRKIIFFASVFMIPRFFDVTNVFYAEPISDIISASVTSIVYLMTIKKILHKRETSGMRDTELEFAKSQID